VKFVSHLQNDPHGSQNMTQWTPRHRLNQESTLRETILIVEDNEARTDEIKGILRQESRTIYTTNSAAEAISVCHDLLPDLIILSIEIPDLSGPRAIDVFKDRAPGVPILAISKFHSIGDAVETMRHGAVDYLAAPMNAQLLLKATDRALQEARLSGELDKARQQVRDKFGISHMLTRSAKMLHVFDQVRAVASTDATVLIRGETGTGKELITRAIHEKSKRRDKPFISVNCGAFTESLLESELFGHEKGSFTGAAGRRQGVFEMADGGTLFLDELGETSLSVQVNLLRVLEEMEFRRVGGHEKVRVDVRILAATNVTLEKAVADGRFREDLYYRLNVFPIELPPLRDRPEDIPLLMRHFLDGASEEYNVKAPMVTSEAIQEIVEYKWPGNVRQLRAMCERWVITRNSQRLEREHLPTTMLSPEQKADAGASFSVDESLPMNELTERAVQKIEKAYIQKTLKATKGHLGETARKAGITRRTLYTKMKLYGLEVGDFREI